MCVCVERERDIRAFKMHSLLQNAVNYKRRKINSKSFTLGIV